MIPMCIGCRSRDWAFEKLYKLGNQIAIDLSCNDCGVPARLLVSSASSQANMTQFGDGVDIVSDLSIKTAGQADAVGIDIDIPF